ncbi:MAG TPA: 4-(cytidine 5'-diphospho)-2-C-methyl-D-erythritol kinase [Gemmatimonadaceae bacterium]|nr:4-(cytidine 5'-diphospho)-2-C-methyl-D-erythritol kinase [Gemmatimonadaceae bacterium]
MTARVARVTAHAKVNLILRVLAREASGFHTLETLFARLALGDLVTVRITDADRSVNCDVAVPGAPEHNLAYRAAQAFADSTGWPGGFAIEIEKRIPIGGGLGGGSADAGAVLRALSALSPEPVREAQLLEIAATLGSDVPYLTTAAPLALAWSRGERMLALPPLPEREVALILPAFTVSTAAAYSWLAASRAGGNAPPAGDVRAEERTGAHPASRRSSPASPQLLSLADLATWRSVASLATNDFEPVVSARHPDIATSLSSLRAAGATITLMSGSGSTVFGVFVAHPDALPIPAGARVLHTRTLTSVSPVEIG